LKLQVAIADLPQCRKDLRVEISADEVKAEFEKSYEALLRSVKIPGFRPGRVPREIIKQRFGKDIKDAVAQSLLPHALEHAITDHQLQIISKPQINDISINEGEPLRFRATVEVLPEFELKEYRGVKMTRRVERVTDEEVEGALEQLRQSFAVLAPVEERMAQDGDLVSVNLAGKYVEPLEEEDLKAEDVQVELGAKTTLPAFTENLRGVVAGDVREFRVTYPDDFGSRGLAGKTLDFTATIVAVRRKEIPSLDDDFARDFGLGENLEETRAKVRETLVAAAEGRADQRLRDKLLRRIMKGYDFDVPSSMVEQKAAERAQEMAYLLLQNGVPTQTIKDSLGAQMNETRAQAVFDVRSALVMARIVAAENIKITEDEIDAEIERMAEMSQESAEQLKARLTKDNSLSSIENRLYYQKALEVVVTHAEITTEEITENQVAEQDQSEAESRAESRSTEQS
jgi:trigger factor